MKVRIDSDEWYPVHFITDSDWGVEVDIPDDQLARINACFDEFQKVQVELSELLKGQS